MRGISLRHIGRYIPIYPRRGETYLYHLNPSCSFPELKDGIGEQILKRRELAVAAKLIGQKTMDTERKIRSGDEMGEADQLMEKRQASKELAPLNLLDVLRNSKGYDLFDQRSNEIYNIVVQPTDAVSLYKLLDQNRIKKLWQGFESYEDIQRAQNALSVDILLEAFDLLDIDTRADFWLVLEDKETKERLLEKLDGQSRIRLLGVIIWHLWKNNSVKSSLEDHFREYFKS
ncbi:MAG: hypothetical protein KKA31_01845, partial [Candidatus Margulisbacteria bacterium]|nr:hypothetical protein [Candidatus Margulisiibacteriota bacterium]